MMSPEARAARLMDEAKHAGERYPDLDGWAMRRRVTAAIREAMAEAAGYAVAAEREACAALADSLEATYEVSEPNEDERVGGRVVSYHMFADAIRGRDMGPGTVRVHFPNFIAADSWLRRDAYRWFVEGYDYALTQDCAIKTLAAVEPEELYGAVSSVLRGARRAGIEVPEQ